MRDVDWNQDGKRLLSCSYDKSSAILDVEKGKHDDEKIYGPAHRILVLI